MKVPLLTPLAGQTNDASRPSNNPKTPPSNTVLALSVSVTHAEGFCGGGEQTVMIDLGNL